jgi:hypothetical protein
VPGFSRLQAGKRENMVLSTATLIKQGKKVDFVPGMANPCEKISVQKVVIDLKNYTQTNKFKIVIGRF